jgi:hypothetical protein
MEDSNGKEISVLGGIVASFAIGTDDGGATLLYCALP